MFDKNLQEFGKAIQIHVFRDSFLTFLMNFMFFENFWPFFVKKLIFGQKSPKNAFQVFFFFFFFFLKNLTISIFLVKFHSKINISIDLTLYGKNDFHQKLPNCANIIKVRKVCEFRDVSEFRDVPEFTWCMVPGCLQ